MFKIDTGQVSLFHEYDDIVIITNSRRRTVDMEYSLTRKVLTACDVVRDVASISCYMERDARCRIERLATAWGKGRSGSALECGLVA